MITDVLPGGGAAREGIKGRLGDDMFLGERDDVRDVDVSSTVCQFTLPGTMPLRDELFPSLSRMRTTSRQSAITASESDHDGADPRLAKVLARGGARSRRCSTTTEIGADACTARPRLRKLTVEHSRGIQSPFSRYGSARQQVGGGFHSWLLFWKN